MSNQHTSEIVGVGPVVRDMTVQVPKGAVSVGSKIDCVIQDSSGGGSLNGVRQVKRLGGNATGVFLVGQDEDGPAVEAMVRREFPGSRVVPCLSGTRRSVVLDGRVHTVRTRTKSLLPTDAISVIADAKLTLMAPMAKEDHPFVRQVLDAAPRVVLQLSAQQVQDADAASQLAEDAWLTVINDAELHAWTGLADPVSGVQSLREHGVSNILVTSKRGVLGFVDSNWVAIPSFQTTMVKNTVAAGDVLVGTLAAALVEGHSWKHAIRLGLAAAALHVEGNAAGGDWQALESVLRQRPAISGSQRVTRSASRLRQQVTGAAVTACLLIGISLGLMWWM